MSDLPSREAIVADLQALDMGLAPETDGPLVRLGQLHVSGRLVDREAIDYEAAARWTHAEMVRRGPTDLTWEAAYPEEQTDHLFLALGAIGAAFGDNKTAQELRAAAFDLMHAAIGDTYE